MPAPSDALQALAAGLERLTVTLRESVLPAPLLVVAMAEGPGVAAATAIPRRPARASSASPVRSRPEPYVEPASPSVDPSVSAVARAQAGDADAFGELYDRYVDVVYRYALCRVGSVGLAEDLTSETFVRALRRISSFSWQGRDFGAWLVTIARNLVADHYKSARFRFEVPTGDLFGAGVDGAVEGPEQQVLDSISSAELLSAVQRLGPEQQECIVLRFLTGLSVSETARVLAKNEGAVKALQYRGVRALRRLLPEGFLP